MSRSRGITLVEMLVALGLVALLGGAAVPLIRTLLLEARMTEAVNALVHGIHAARQLAQTEMRDAVVCRSTGAMQCSPPGDWSDGWIVFVNRDGDDPSMVDAGEPIVVAQQRRVGVSMTSNRRAYVLHPSYLRATNGTVVFCDKRGARSARAVVVSYTGRPRVAWRSASGRPLTCPR